MPDSREEGALIYHSAKPTFVAINLEDIRAPACFAIEKALPVRNRKVSSHRYAIVDS